LQGSGLGSNTVGNAIIADHREDLVRTIYTGRLMGDPERSHRQIRWAPQIDRIYRINKMKTVRRIQESVTE